MVAGMLSALGQATRQFAVDSFKVQETESLEVFQIGELQVHMLVGRQAILAAVVRGTLPQEVKVTLSSAPLEGRVEGGRHSWLSS